MATMTKPRPITPQVAVTSVFEATASATQRTIVNVGGRGSSKSYSIAQLLIQKFTSQEGVKIGVTRKTFPALYRTCYDLVLTLLKEWGIYPLVQHDKTHHTICYKDSAWKQEAKMDFFALDDPTKITSSDFNYLWLEEALEFTWEDYVVLSTSLRSPCPPGQRNRIYLSLNPTDANSWIATKLVIQSDVAVIRSTYKHNPFCEPDYIQTLENLIFEDDNFYRVYCLGEWGRLENIIFTKYDEVEGMPQGCKWVYGLDFGFIHPTALVRVGQDEKGQIYLDERIYKTKLTNADLIELLSHEDRADIYADSAEPQRIEEIHRAGYTIYPAYKDVKYGIDLMKRQMLHITKNSVGLWKEIRGYHNKKDKDGHVIEEPVKYNDDAIDSARYGLCGLVERYGSAVSMSPCSVEVIHTLTFAGRREYGILVIGGNKWLNQRS